MNTKTKILIGVSGLLCIATLAGCQLKKTPDNWVAKIGRNTITLDQLNTRLVSYAQTLPAPQQQALQEKNNKIAFLDQLINEEILFQEAKKSGYLKSEEVKNRIATLKDQIEQIKKQTAIDLLIKDKIDTEITVTDAEVKAFYDQNKAQFEAKEQRRARHILVKTRKKAASIKDRLNRGQNFATLARRFSEDPSKNNGGDLGWFKKGDLVPEFEKAVFALEKRGSISGIVKTQFGYHIIQLSDKTTIPEQKLETVTNQIKSVIQNQKKSQQVNSFVNNSRGNYKIDKKLESIQ